MGQILNTKPRWKFAWGRKICFPCLSGYNPSIGLGAILGTLSSYPFSIQNRLSDNQCVHNTRAIFCLVFLCERRKIGFPLRFSRPTPLKKRRKIRKRSSANFRFVCFLRLFLLCAFFRVFFLRISLPTFSYLFWSLDGSNFLQTFRRFGN